MTWQRRSARSARLPKNWRSTIRPAVFARDGDICHLCGQPGSDTIDHKRPGDDHSLNNLGPVHDRNWPHCHRYKTALEGVDARPKPTRAGPAHPASKAG